MRKILSTILILGLAVTGFWFFQNFDISRKNQNSTTATQQREVAQPEIIHERPIVAEHNPPEEEEPEEEGFIPYTTLYVID